MPKLFGTKKSKEPQGDPLQALVMKERLRLLKKMGDAGEHSVVDGVERGSKRHKSHKVGEIVIEPSGTISCLVTDYSDSGMRLVLTEAADAPDQFRLRVPTLEFDRLVAVVWRNEAALGISWE